MKTALILFVKNEVQDIDFWLAWHLYCGFNTIIIYDDHSTDGTWELINQAAEAADIRCHRAPDADQFNIRQQKTYLDAIDRYREEFDWLLFLDSDEYLDIRNGDDVQTFLTSYKNAHGIALNWACYGSSNHVIKPASANVFENYTQRSNPDFEYNYTVKSFIQPKHTKTAYVNPHRFEVSGDYVTTDYKPVSWQEKHPERTTTLAQWNVARVNHYLIRSAHHYIEKMSRRVDIRDSHAGLNLFQYCDRNEHYDPVLSKRYDKMMPYLYEIQNQINQEILKLMISTYGRGLNGELSQFSPPTKALPKIHFLKTIHNTILGYSKETGRICHKEQDIADEHFVPMIAITSPLYPDRIFLTSKIQEQPLFASHDPRVSTFLSYNQEYCTETHFALRNPVTGLLVSALNTSDTEHNLEMNRSRIREWEQFSLISLDDENMLSEYQEAFSLLKTLPDPSKASFTNLKLASDVFISAIQALTPHIRLYWRARNRLPSYAWLEHQFPLSV